MTCFFAKNLYYSVSEQVDPYRCASSGMFVSLSAVMLKLCEPFLDATFSKRDKIDAAYILYKARVDFR